MRASSRGSSAAGTRQAATEVRFCSFYDRGFDFRCGIACLSSASTPLR